MLSAEHAVAEDELKGRTMRRGRRRRELGVEWVGLDVGCQIALTRFGAWHRVRAAWQRALGYT